MTVIEVVHATRVAPGDTIGVVQLGGMGDDGLFYEMDTDPLLKTGAKYLLFLRDNEPLNGRDEFVSAVFGRFIINDKGLIQPNGWDGEPGVGAVSGVTREEILAARYSQEPEAAKAALTRTSVEQAKEKILAAITEGPLPPPPTPSPTPGSPRSTERDGTSVNQGSAAGTPPLWYAASLRTMVEAYDTIVVGQVTGTAGSSPGLGAYAWWSYIGGPPGNYILC